MCSRVETRSSKKPKKNIKEVHKQGSKSEGRTSKGEEQVASKSASPTLNTPVAVGKTPSAQPSAKADEASVQVLRRDYVPDIKDEVSELLKEALCAKTPSENQKTSGPSADSSTTSREQRRMDVTAQNPHYDVVEDLGNQRAYIPFTNCWKITRRIVRR